MKNFITLPDGNIINTSEIKWIGKHGPAQRIIYIQSDPQEGGFIIGNDFFEKEVQPALEAHGEWEEKARELNARLARLTEAMDRLSAHIPSSLRVHY